MQAFSRPRWLPLRSEVGSQLPRCQYVHVKDSYSDFFLETLTEFIAIAERESGESDTLDIALVLRKSTRL